MSAALVNGSGPDDTPSGWYISHSRITDTLHFGPFATFDEAKDWFDNYGSPQGVHGVFVPLYRTVRWDRGHA